MQFLQNIHGINDIIKKIKEYQTYILLGIGITAMLVGSTYGYLYYKKNKEEKAYRALVTALEYVDAPISKELDKQEDFKYIGKKEFASEKEKWEKVASVCQEAYKKHCGAGIAPLFLVYHAEALTQQKHHDKAIDVLQKAIAAMRNDAVKDYFEVKLALMMLDAKKDEGLAMLQRLAAKTDSVAHDRALYSLGEYYWYKKDFAQARNYWNQFMVAYGKAEKNISPFASHVKEKLKLIDSDAA